jgi:hypothetical protein
LSLYGRGHRFDPDLGNHKNPALNLQWRFGTALGKAFQITQF